MAVTNPFEVGNNYLTQGANMAANAVSPESRNRAAARLRADLDVTRNRGIAQVDDAAASTGGLNSGRAGLNRSRIWDGYFNSLSQGLGTIENQQAQNTINAAGVMNSAGAGLNNSAQAQSNIKAGALNTYIQGGNALANPTGQGAQDAFGSLGLDVTGLGFFGPPGTTNPINVGSGTTVNVGTGTGAGTTPGTGSTPGTIPGGTSEEIFNNIKPTLHQGGAYSVSRTRLEQGDPVTTMIYKYLAEELGMPVQIVAPGEPGFNDVNSTYYFERAGHGPGSIG